MTKKITFAPVDMTEAVMQDLEDKGLIIRLCPNHHELPAKPGETLGESVYESDRQYGAHKLITVTVNRSTFEAFGTHPDNEEFLFIGDATRKPMYLVVALHRREALDQKIAAGQLEANDFVCLRVAYNDPTVSFFTMLADVPHGEAVADVNGPPPSFYVTEPCDMGIDFTDFGGYELCVPVE